MMRFFTLPLYIILLFPFFVYSQSNSTDSSKDTDNDISYSTKHIGTSSLLTCMDNSELTASFFDVRFYPDNRTLYFDIDATTTLRGNVLLNVQLLTYGLKVVDESIDLCSLHVGTICPLSTGRLELRYEYQVPAIIANQIPNIAYTIPDLDAQVRVVAFAQNDTAMESPLACVLAFLNNDKTVQTKYAAWPIAAISGVGVLTSGFVSVMGYSVTSAHIASNSISLFVYFQNLAITAMMGVSRVPPIAAAWTQNFQWSMGIINVEFMQKALSWYLQSTGGTSSVVVSNKDILSISVQKRSLQENIAFLKRGVHQNISVIKRGVENNIALLKRGVSVVSSNDYNFDNILDDSSLYTTSEKSPDDYTSKILVLRGIQRVAFMAGIEITNFYLTGVVFTLFFLFIVILSLVGFKLIVELLIRSNFIKREREKRDLNFLIYKNHWISIIKGTLFRLSIIAFPQISLLSLWEFTEVDSAGIIVDAIVVLVVFMGLLVYGTVRVMIRGNDSMKIYRNPAYLLYNDSSFLNKYGFLYVQFKADKFWWLVPILIYTFFRSLFVATLQDHGKPQALIIFLIELAYFSVLCWKRPYLDKRTNIFNILIHLITLINALFFLFFSDLFNQPAVVSSVMAIVLFVLNALFALFLLIFTIITCTLALVHRNPDARYQPMKDDRVSFIPVVESGFEGKDKSQMELFELRQAVMSTDNLEAYPDLSIDHDEMEHGEGKDKDFFKSSDASQTVMRTLNVKEDDDHNSVYTTTSSLSLDNGNKSRATESLASLEPVIPGSAVLDNREYNSYTDREYGSGSRDYLADTRDYDTDIRDYNTGTGAHSDETNESDNRAGRYSGNGYNNGYGYI